jgi:CRP-like cAMP-binding protein
MSDVEHADLARRGWLANTPPAFRDALLASAQVQQHAAGTLFSRAGETGHSLWGVSAGQIVVSSGMNGADSAPGLLFNPGDWGGYMPVFGRPRPANCRALTDVTLLTVSYPRLRSLLAEQPAWWEHLGQLAMMNGLTFATVAIDLLIRNSERRLAAVLLNLAGCRRSGEPYPLHLTLAELGEMSGLSRHPVAGVLGRFETRGWIIRGYRLTRLTDAAALRHMADGE